MTEHSQELSRATGSSAKTTDSAPPGRRSTLWWLLILVAAISFGLIVWSSSPSSSSSKLGRSRLRADWCFALQCGTRSPDFRSEAARLSEQSSSVVDRRQES